MPVLSPHHLKGHRELRLAHLALGFITMGYVWQEGQHLPAQVKISSEWPLTSDMNTGICLIDCWHVRCLCLLDSPQIPGSALLAGLQETRPTSHPDLCRLCSGQLETQGPYRVSWAFDPYTLVCHYPSPLPTWPLSFQPVPVCHYTYVHNHFVY